MESKPTQCCEGAVIGAGPGGLAAAIYLARFNRQVLVFDGGKTRASYSPRNRNYPGFPEGISGDEMLAAFREQAERFNVDLVPQCVVSLQRRGTDFLVQADEFTVEARAVILATGVRDIWPEVPGIEELAGLRIRVCPICDAYETNGKRVGLLGCGDKVAREALYLCDFAHRVELFTYGLEAERPICAELLGRLREAGVELHSGRVEQILPEGETASVVCLEGGSKISCHLLFSALGVRVQAGLACALGAKIDEDGYLVTDRQQQTTIPGLYAVGDVTSAINQVTVAVGQAAIAATALHNSLQDF